MFLELVSLATLPIEIIKKNAIKKVLIRIISRTNFGKKYCVVVFKVN